MRLFTGLRKKAVQCVQDTEVESERTQDSEHALFQYTLRTLRFYSEGISKAFQTLKQEQDSRGKKNTDFLKVNLNFR